jgi:hypothetical protein
VRGVDDEAEVMRVEQRLDLLRRQALRRDGHVRARLDERTAVFRGDAGGHVDPVRGGELDELPPLGRARENTAAQTSRYPRGVTSLPPMTFVAARCR